jgi:site-specific recombinase XerD
MPAPTITVTIDLAAMSESWAITLEAEGKSLATLKAYARGVESFLDWHAGQGDAAPVLDRATVSAYLADLRRDGQSDGTIRLRYSALKLFSRWLAEEGETERDELARMTPPKAGAAEVDSLPEPDIAALLKACAGQGFADRRDYALITVLNTCGLRAAECIALRTGDVDLRAGELRVVKGKGSKSRRVGFGPQTARALDRYMRARRAHPLAGSDVLWLPQVGKGPKFTYQGLAQMIRVRAGKAGLTGVHAHRLRHSFASAWLAKGGSEDGLMAAAGWSDRNMISLYSRDTAQARSVAEAKRLAL